jgi:hypothetical protein
MVGDGSKLDARYVRKTTREFMEGPVDIVVGYW